MISFSDFSKVNLSVGEILSVQQVEGSDKLLQLKVDIGSDEPRNILSGIKKNYSEDELTGKKCVIVSNLEPREMMGMKSEGMILCSSFELDGEEVVEIVMPPKNSPNGTMLS